VVLLCLSLSEFCPKVGNGSLVPELLREKPPPPPLEVLVLAGCFVDGAPPKLKPLPIDCDGAGFWLLSLVLAVTGVAPKEKPVPEAGAAVVLEATAGVPKLKAPAPDPPVLLTVPPDAGAGVGVLLPVDGAPNANPPPLLLPNAGAEVDPAPPVAPTPAPNEKPPAAGAGAGVDEEPPNEKPPPLLLLLFPPGALLFVPLPPLLPKLKLAMINGFDCGLCVMVEW
jgi:hypothetical protein